MFAAFSKSVHSMSMNIAVQQQAAKCCLLICLPAFALHDICSRLQYIYRIGKLLCGLLPTWGPMNAQGSLAEHHDAGQYRWVVVSCWRVDRRPAELMAKISCKIQANAGCQH